MRRTLKTLFSLALALVLVLSMAPAVAAAVTNSTVTFTGVADGDTLTAYKLVSYTTGYNSYEFDGSFDSFVTSYKNSNGTDEQKAMANAAYLDNLGTTGITALIKAYATAAQATSSSYTLPTSSATGTGASGNGASLTLEPGYYLILGTTTAGNSYVYTPAAVFVQVLGDTTKTYVNGTETTTSAVKKETAPSVEKNVKETSDSTYSTTATASVGDTVSFRVKVVIPAYTDGTTVNALVLNDTLTNLQYDSTAGVRVYTNADCTSEIASAVTNTAPGQYDSSAHTQTLAITLAWDTIKANTNFITEVYVVYQATVTADAAANDKAENTVSLTYTVNGTSNTTTTSTTTVYSYALQVSKVDDSATPVALTGAKFKVYTAADSTTPLGFVEVTNGTDTYYRPAVSGETGTVTEIGADFLIKGLDEGDYYLEESTVPSGYYAPNGRFKVTLTAATDGNSNATSELAASSSASTVDNADDGLISSSSVNSSTKSQYDVTIKNSSMANLPSTGGVGTAIFTVGGIALMALAAWLFFSRRKGSAK